MGKVLFKNLSIRRKLVLLIVGITSGALLTFTLFSAFTQVRNMRKAMFDNLTVLSKSVAELSTAALSFSDTDGGVEILTALRTDPDVELAVIYDKFNEPFASYRGPEFPENEELPNDVPQKQSGFVFLRGVYKLEIRCPITLGDNILGFLYILSNTDRMKAYILNAALWLAVSLVAILIGTVLITTRLQALITRPVSILAQTARKISQKGDYSVRVEKLSQDEVGQLIDDFNSMLQAVQDRDQELQQHHQNLEQLVEERTEELRRKRDEALAAARAKSEFLANMSHEIRTPMNGVIGVLSLLKDAPLSEEYRRLHDTASRSADSLLLIINDILDFSKIDAGKITFESIIFNLRELVEDTAGLFTDTVNLKKIDFNCYIPTDLPCYIQGDPTRLRQVLTNLISNGLKFTENGEVSLNVEQVRREGMVEELLFSVEDTGIGIAQEATGQLFEKFTQADGSTTRKYGGTGLGLSVCKQLVEKQGGTIGVESEFGHGSKFWFKLSFTIVEDAVPLIPYSEIEHKRVLVIDDSKACTACLSGYLDYCNIDYIACNDVGQAWNLLEECKRSGASFDLVLVDYTLPGNDGLQLISRIKSSFAEVVKRLILMTTVAFIGDKLQKSGADGWILKPVRLLELYDTLANRNGGKKKVTLADAKPVVDSDQLLQGTILLVDDEPVNQKVAMAILRKHGLVTEVAHNGFEAVAMTEDKDYSVVLMDIQMPEMSGFEATERIRKRERQEGRKRSTIIAMTANAMESTRKRCMEVGMDDFFTKPIKPAVLVERLRPWLERECVEYVDDRIEVEEPEQSESPHQAQQEFSENEIWDVDTAMEFVGGDTELFGELIELFLERNGKLLGNLDEAIKTGDADAVRNAAHAYKGALNHFAAVPARDLAFAIEKLGKGGVLDDCQDLYEQLSVQAELLVGVLTNYLER